MFTQIPPGTYYLQRNDSVDQPWSAPFTVDDTRGGLTVTLDREEVSLVPVTEVPAELSLAFLGFTDTFDKPWWRTGSGALNDKAPPEWDLDQLRQTKKRELKLPTRGRDARTDAAARLMREAVNLIVAPEHRVDPDAAPVKTDISTAGSTHPLAQHIEAFGLSGGTGMSVRLLTSAADRTKDLYYLEASRHGPLPHQFFFGHLTPDVRLAKLKDELVSCGHSQAADWTAEKLVSCLTDVILRHQAAAAESMKG